MEKNSTLKSFAAPTQPEKKNSKELISSLQPHQSTIRNILNYSKALDIRKTKNFGWIEFVIN